MALKIRSHFALVFFRKEKRKAYFDMQTFNIHYPQNDRGKMKPIIKPRVGHYPIALIPGQFTDHYQTYSSNQLKYMPLSTALKSAPKRPRAYHMAMATSRMHQLKKEAKLRATNSLRSDGSDSSSDSDSSGSSSDDDSSSSSEDDSSDDESDVGILDEPPAPKKARIGNDALISKLIAIQESALTSSKTKKNQAKSRLIKQYQ